MISAMEVWVKPRRAKQAVAASRICSRRAARVASERRGMQTE